MNLVAFVGEITEMPKLRESAVGNKFAIMPIRIQRPFANSEGVFESDDITVTLWKGIAEMTTDIAKPGDMVSVKGRLQSHSYEGNDGLVHHAYDVIAEHVAILNNKKEAVTK